MRVPIPTNRMIAHREGESKGAKQTLMGSVLRDDLPGYSAAYSEKLANFFCAASGETTKHDQK